jgi:hypothetical protein
MKLKHLVPPEVLAELEEVASELRAESPYFDPARDPMDRIAVMMHWSIREIVRMRKQEARDG